VGEQGSTRRAIGAVLGLGRAGRDAQAGRATPQRSGGGLAAGSRRWGRVEARPDGALAFFRKAAAGLRVEISLGWEVMAGGRVVIVSGRPL
jgi:hypothetical protein